MISPVQSMILIAAREVLENADPCFVFDFADFVNGIALRLCDENDDICEECEEEEKHETDHA